MNTKRHKLPNGQWIEAYEELKHGTVRKCQEIMGQILMYPDVKRDEKGEAIVEEDGKVSLDGKVEINWDKVNINKNQSDHIMILNQVTRWSFDPEVTAEVLEELSEREYQAIKGVMDSIYASPLAKKPESN